MSSGANLNIAQQHWVLYQYVPSLPAAVVFTALFLGLALFHTYKLISTRALYFSTFTLGCYLETTGYTLRIASHYNDQANSPFILQSLFLLIAPALLAASIYMSLKRLLQAVELNGILDPFPVDWTTRFFVIGDIISLVGQGAGGGLLALALNKGNLTTFNTGKAIILAALGVQLAFLAGFIILLSCCLFKMQKLGKYKGSQSFESELSAKFGDVEYMAGYGKNPLSLAMRLSKARTVIILLQVSSILILLRSVFRTVEYVQGPNGYLISKEVFLYTFDGLLMLVVTASFAWWYPKDVWRSENGY